MRGKELELDFCLAPTYLLLLSLLLWTCQPVSDSKKSTVYNQESIQMPNNFIFLKSNLCVGFMGSF